MKSKFLSFIAWILICALLVFMMQPGFMCLESGLTRSKNSINVAIKNLTDFVISVVVFWVLGFALMHGTSMHGWFGLSGWFFDAGQEEAHSLFCFSSHVLRHGHHDRLRGCGRKGSVCRIYHCDDPDFEFDLSAFRSLGMEFFTSWGLWILPDQAWCIVSVDGFEASRRIKAEALQAASPSCSLPPWTVTKMKPKDWSPAQ